MKTPCSEQHYTGRTVPNKRRTLRAVVYLVLGMVAASWSTATLPAQNARSTVRLDGRPIFRVGITDTISTADRALRIERRLTTLLEVPHAGAPAQVQPAGPQGTERMITVAGVPVVTVMQADAEDNAISQQPSTVGLSGLREGSTVPSRMSISSSRRLRPPRSDGVIRGPHRSFGA